MPLDVQDADLILVVVGGGGRNRGTRLDRARLPLASVALCSANGILG